MTTKLGLGIIQDLFLHALIFWWKYPVVKLIKRIRILLLPFLVTVPPTFLVLEMQSLAWSVLYFNLAIPFREYTYAALHHYSQICNLSIDLNLNPKDNCHLYMNVLHLCLKWNLLSSCETSFPCEIYLEVSSKYKNFILYLFIT